MTDSSSVAGLDHRLESSRSIPRLLLIMLVCLSGMTFYEVAKQWFFPGIAIWTSHAMTIVFSTLVGTLAGYLMLRNYRTLNQLAMQELAERTRLQAEHARSIKELRDALDSIKVLRGLIPICGSCKRIRDDEGYWSEIESYVRDHSEAEFNHSLCEECAKRLYPEFYAEAFPEGQ